MVNVDLLLAADLLDVVEHIDDIAYATWSFFDF